ncbi:TIGR03086 family metal-binding protein [Streptomyces sp. NPDC004111]|uniref:TIGR03086 family metal-binding protein n=1 Tax=Streptomyces sp. NPDC004111 TaxID=3364690 RepID=UPI00368C5826
MGDPRVVCVNIDDAEAWSIGEVARKTGLTVKLVRHWSDTGVVPPASRTSAGYRVYGPDAVVRLELARTLRDLGLGLAAIRDVLDREHTLAEVAAAHADALEERIRTLRSQQAVLRSVTRRNTTTEGIASMTALARMSAAERRTLIREFVTGTLADLDVPAYRRGLLAATPELPDDPTDEQVDAWLELSELVADPALRTGMRRMARYAAAYAPGEHDEDVLREVQRVTDHWLGLVGAAMADGLAPDSPAADALVAEVVAAWLPSQALLPDPPRVDDARARRVLLEQLEVASDAHVERYWQLLCLINGLPVRPGMAAAGAWLTTALRTNPEPGARAAELDGMYDSGADAWGPAGVLSACREVLAAVNGLVAAVVPDQFALATPCADWDVRALLDHLVWENLLWAGLAEGAPRTDMAADHLGADHVEAFRTASDAALAAFGRPGMLDRRYGPAPGRRLVEQLVIEMLVHGWDLARATGQDRDLVPGPAGSALPVVREIFGGLPRTAAGSFAPPRPVPDDAPALDRLAAYLGRTPS